MATNPLDLLRMRKMALAGANRRPAAAAFLDMAGQTGQAPQAPMPSIAEGARLRALKALGASQQPTASITKPRLLTPTSAASGAGSMLPGRGTPGSAALGAFGSTMSQLGGWQDKPMTFGQILGASLGKAREAYGTAEERQRQIAADKAAAERQAMLDEYKLRELQVKEAKEKREAGAKPKRESKVVDGALYEKNPETGKWEVAVAKTQDAKTPGLPTIGAVRKRPIGDRMVQAEEYKKTDSGYDWVAFGKPESLDAPGTSAALKKPYPVNVMVNGKKGTVRKRFVGVGAEGADENGEITVPNSFIADDVKVSDLETVDDYLIVNGERSLAKVYRKITPDGSVTMIEDPSSPNRLRPIDPETDELIPKDDRWQNSFMDKKHTEYRGQQRGIKMFEQMRDALETQEPGIKGALIKFGADIKTLMGRKDLTQKEINQQLAKGMQQGLLGQIRVDVVGPGVMTEQDAERLVLYLGGDLRNLDTNPATVQQAVEYVLSLKIKEFNENIPIYNSQQQLFGKRSGYSRFEPVEDFNEALGQY